MKDASSDMSDAAVIKAIIDGDKEMFGVLITRYSSMLYGYAINLCHDRDQAAELVQNTLITAYSNLDKLRSPAAVGGWMIKIMRNSYVSGKRKSEPDMVSLDSLTEQGNEPSVLSEEERFSPEELKAIMKLVYSLPEKYREILILRYVKDITYKKIAEILELPVSTVTTRLNHARKLLVRKAKAGGII